MLLLAHRRQSCIDRAGRALVVPACLRMDTRPTVSYSATPSQEDLANADTLVLPGSNQDLEPTTACAEVPDTTPSGAPGPQASIEGQPPAAEQSQPKLVLTEQAWTQAFQNYAKAKGVDISNVTRDMIKSSAEGAVHWSTMQQDMSARGPSAQAMGRAFKHRPDVRETYGILLDSLKADFRRSWTASRSFDFADISKQTVHSFTKRKEDTRRSYRSK